tara:strand:- start:1539 stop:1769 length:231 start_codon:yes stop_codon:yes gene_type:complete
MPKYIVKEGILDKFLSKLFSNVAKGKGHKVAKLLDKDPELQALTKKAIDNRNKMQKHIEKKRKNDADYDYFYKALK